MKDPDVEDLIPQKIRKREKISTQGQEIMGTLSSRILPPRNVRYASRRLNIR